MEAELGKKLLVRGSFSVRLTDEGMLLRKRAEDILDMVDKTVEIVEATPTDALIFDKLVDTSERSELCFRPLTPKLETKLYLIWKKYQVFTPAAQLLLNEMKGC